MKLNNEWGEGLKILGKVDQEKEVNFGK